VFLIIEGTIQTFLVSGDHTRAIRASEDAITMARQVYGATHIRVGTALFGVRPKGPA
jgi:alanine racemase